MASKTINDLTAATVLSAASDKFIVRQGSDTSDKSASGVLIAEMVQASTTPTDIGAQILHGFDGRTGSSMSFAAGTFTLTVPTSQVVYVGGTKVTLTSNKTVAVSGDLVTKYITMDNTGTLAVSNTAWGITSFSAIPVATLYLDGANYCLGDERHSCNRSVTYHEEHHKTIGSVYQSGLTGTFTNTTLSMAQGAIYDEDLALDTGGTVTTNGWFYRNAGRTAMRLESGKTTPYAVSAGALQYDNSGTLASVASGSYVVNWIYATNCSVNPIVCVISQAQYSNSGDAAQAALPTLSGFSTLEWKLLYSVTYRNVGGTPTYISSADYRRSSLGPATASIANTHAALTGRDATDSHPATAVSNTPAGNIAATTVQAAINELDTEKLTKGTESGTNSTATHGAVSTGDNSVSLGQGAGATAANAIAIGLNSSAAIYGIAVGGSYSGATSAAAGAIAIGINGTGACQATQTDALCIGTGAQGTSTRAIGLGKDAVASSSDSVQIGTGTNSTATTMQFRGNRIADADGLALTAGTGISLSKAATGVTITASGGAASTASMPYNMFDNPNFSVNQRAISNTSITTGSLTPIFDRWRANQGSGGFNWYVLPDTTVPSGSTSATSLKATSNSAGGTFELIQRFTASQVSAMRNGTCTISLWVKTPTGVTNAVKIALGTPSATNNFTTVTVRNGAFGWTSSSLTANAWNNITYSFDPSAWTNIDKGMEFRLILAENSSQSYYLADFQMNAGSTANTFVPPEYNEELWKCYPFLYRFDFETDSNWISALATSATQAYTSDFRFPRKMNAVPTLSSDMGTMTNTVVGNIAGTSKSVSSVSLTFASKQSAVLGMVTSNVAGTGAFVWYDDATTPDTHLIFQAEP